MSRPKPKFAYWETIAIISKSKLFASFIIITKSSFILSRRFFLLISVNFLWVWWNKQRYVATYQFRREIKMVWWSVSSCNANITSKLTEKQKGIVFALTRDWYKFRLTLAERGKISSKERISIILMPDRRVHWISYFHFTLA